MQADPDLARKLGIKASLTVVAINAGAEALTNIKESAPAGSVFLTELPAGGVADIVLIWLAAKDDLPRIFERLEKAICPNGAVWAIIPKKTAGKTGRTQVNFDQVQAAALQTGLVDNKVATISESEYGIRFVVRKARRAVCGDPRQEKSDHMSIRGQVHKYGANVDTDAIIPARYLNVFDAATLAKHCMEDIDVEFVKKVKPGDIIVAGPNFGSGSSREHAPVAIKASGVSCVVADSFARIFYRNAINIGLPILECPEAAKDVQAGDTLEVDFQTGKIKNISRGRTYQAHPFPAFMMELIAAGGLVAYTRRRLEAKRAV